jgi:hypothetical protein
MKKILKIDRMEKVSFEKKPENKICSQMYEVFDLKEWFEKLLLSSKNSHKIEANKSKPEEK